MSNTTFVAFDGLSVIRRIYEARREPDSPEKAAAGVEASVRKFANLVRRLKPTHAAVAIDHGGNTWRHDLYPRYRFERPEMPYYLRKAMPELMERLEVELGIKTFCVPFVEADDVLAALIRRWPMERGRAVVVSCDKDLMQLVADGAEFYHPFDDKFFLEAEVRAKFEVGPDRVQDYLALVGDATDGIPGVRGIGPSNAVTLLTQYGSLEEIIKHRNDIPGYAGQRLCQDFQSAQVSYRLAHLEGDLSLGVAWRDLLLGAPRQARMTAREPEHAGETNAEPGTEDTHRAGSVTTKTQGSGSPQPSSAPVEMPPPPPATLQMALM